MSATGLNKLIGQACISDTFQAGLMNGRRAELIREFELEADEAGALLAIRADSFADFAAVVEHMLEQARESRPVRVESPFISAVRWPSQASTGVYFRQQR
jgi:hypothetical protein